MSKVNLKSSNRSDYYKFVLLLGFTLAIGLILLKQFDVYYITYRLNLEFYIGLIAVLFLIVGLTVGIKLHKQNAVNNPAFRHKKAILPENLQLSSREVEILSYISKGYSNNEIAELLFVSINTIKTHTNNIYSKLNVKRRTQAVEVARNLKLIP